MVCIDILFIISPVTLCKTNLKIKNLDFMVTLTSQKHQTPVLQAEKQKLT